MNHFYTRKIYCHMYIFANALSLGEPAIKKRQFSPFAQLSEVEENFLILTHQSFFGSAPSRFSLSSFKKMCRTGGQASDNVFGSYFFYNLSFRLDTKRPMLLERGRIEHGLHASVLNFKK